MVICQDCQELTCECETKCPKCGCGACQCAVAHPMFTHCDDSGFASAVHAAMHPSIEVKLVVKDGEIYTLPKGFYVD